MIIRMRIVELTYLEDASVFESVVGVLGFEIQLHELRTCPGARHYHLKKPGHVGTLEATWWPKARRFWLQIHAKRGAPWQEACIAEIERRFNIGAHEPPNLSDS